MPNHVINEIIISNLKLFEKRRILRKVVSKKREIDFELLLPSPLNSWKHNSGIKHEGAFPTTDLKWCRENWGTKWGAYGLKENEYKPVLNRKTKIVFTFKTAWSPPRGWILALFNYFKISFIHNWLSEGEERGHQEIYNYEKMENDIGDPWEVKEIDDDLQKHLHFLLWGCEEFDDDE